MKKKLFKEELVYAIGPLVPVEYKNGDCFFWRGWELVDPMR